MRFVVVFVLFPTIAEAGVIGDGHVGRGLIYPAGLDWRLGFHVGAQTKQIGGLVGLERIYIDRPQGEDVVIWEDRYRAVGSLMWPFELPDDRHLSIRVGFGPEWAGMGIRGTFVIKLPGQEPPPPDPGSTTIYRGWNAEAAVAYLWPVSTMRLGLELSVDFAYYDAEFDGRTLDRKSVDLLLVARFGE